MAAILVHHLGFVQILQKPSKPGSKVIETNKNTIKRSKHLKNVIRKLFLILLIRGIEIFEKYACQNRVNLAYIR